MVCKYVAIRIVCWQNLRQSMTGGFVSLQIPSPPFAACRRCGPGRVKGTRERKQLSLTPVSNIFRGQWQLFKILNNIDVTRSYIECGKLNKKITT